MIHFDIISENIIKINYFFIFYFLIFPFKTLPEYINTHMIFCQHIFLFFMQIFLIPSSKANYDDIKTSLHGFFQAK